MIKVFREEAERRASVPHYKCGRSGCGPVEKVPKSLEVSVVGSGCLATHALSPGWGIPCVAIHKREQLGISFLPYRAAVTHDS